MKYARYNNDFIRAKKLVKKRDGYRCSTCGVLHSVCIEKQGRGLEVHHRNGDSNDLDNLISLCQDCHLSIHGRKKNNPFSAEVIKIWVDGGYTFGEIARRTGIGKYGIARRYNQVFNRDCL